MRFAALFLFLAALCAACGEDTPTTPSATVENAVERFDDILNVRDSRFFAFSVGSNGQTSFNLASLSPINGPGSITATVEIGWGKIAKDGDGNIVGCTLAKVMQVTPSLASQLTDTLAPAQDYCANIADVGGLRESVNFSMRISHP